MMQSLLSVLRCVVAPCALHTSVYRHLCLTPASRARPRTRPPRPWTSAEDAQLRAAVQAASENDVDDVISWADICKALPDRDARACRQRWKNSLDTARRIGPWTRYELRRLSELAEVHAPDYALIAQLLPTRRAHHQVRERLVEGGRSGQPWTAAEDALLLKAVRRHGRAWVRVAEDVPNRTDGQCLERWSISVDPRLRKGPWTEEEDRKLEEIVQLLQDMQEPFHFGTVAEQIGGTRSRKACRSRWEILEKRASTRAEGS